MFTRGSAQRYPGEVVIFQDGNSPGTYVKGKRADKQLLVNKGGFALDETSLKVNERGDIWAPTEWDDSGRVTDFRTDGGRCFPFPSTGAWKRCGSRYRTSISVAAKARS